MLTRRGLLGGAAAAAMSAGSTRRARSASPPTTLRIIHASDLQSLDPIWTTAPPTKDYAFLTFDQLIAVDADFVPRPQMAEGWNVEDNGRSVVIGLRDGLKFHDGVPVRSADCIASIARWSARDGFGQGLRHVTDTMEVIDDRRFRIRLKQPFPLLPAAIGKSSSSQCFIMPERMAKTDPMRQVTEWIGSGPYRFLRDEWVAGSRVAWARFDGYLPRPEPVSGIAGGRVPAVDRVEWTILGDAATAYAALQNGELDFWDSPASDLIPAIQARPNLVVRVRNSSGSYQMLQFNHLQRPFNDPAIRQAVAMAVDQQVFLQAAVARPEMIRVCESYFACGTAYGTDVGAEVLQVRSIERAGAALQAAGYAGEKVVILGVAESPVLFAMAQVADDMLRKMGMNSELVTTDFASMAQRRTNREPVEKGGWSIFITAWTGSDILNPAVNQMLRGAGTGGWFGWPTNEPLEALRNEWFVTADPEEQARIAARIQIEGFRTLPYIPLGSTVSYVAYSKALTGVFDAPVNAYWNIGKAD
jgi:peptide/nickel transport system substrate-binding protein